MTCIIVHINSEPRIVFFTVWVKLPCYSMSKQRIILYNYKVVLQCELSLQSTDSVWDTWAQSASHTSSACVSTPTSISVVFSAGKVWTCRDVTGRVATTAASLYWLQRLLWLMIQRLKRPTTATGLVVPILPPSSGLNCHSNWDEVTRNFNGPRVSLAENYFLRRFHQFIWKMLLTSVKMLTKHNFKMLFQPNIWYIYFTYLL